MAATRAGATAPVQLSSGPGIPGSLSQLLYSIKKALGREDFQGGLS